MAPHMVCVLPYLNSNAQVRRLRISVPLGECLIDGQKYFLPDDLPPAAGEELWPFSRIQRDWIEGNTLFASVASGFSLNGRHHDICRRDNRHSPIKAPDLLI